MNRRTMRVRTAVHLLPITLGLAIPALSRGQEVPDDDSAYQEIEKAPHDYWKRPLQDRFTAFKAELDAGKITLDYGNEKSFLLSLLKALGIPVSSQLLVFSTTSLQLRFITPSNPRALYFNEDVYVGYIPGGRIEIVSLDPELGAIFYIFDIPRGPGPLRIERSDRCMNCHAGDDTGYVPGLVIRSVLPGPSGGSLKSFRSGLPGHGVPFHQRFGGWYVTGLGFTNHWGNLLGRSSPEGLSTRAAQPGVAFDFSRYPATTSDGLAHLLHDHQAGFVNRVVEASYRARSYLHEGKGKLGPEHQLELDRQAEIVVRYALFADEVPVPQNGVVAEVPFKEDFLRTRRAVAGMSLKDFDLKTRMFRHRCSYMIYSSVFKGLPVEMKNRVYTRLQKALSVAQPDAEYAYLPEGEKAAIRRILKATLSDLPADW